MDRVNTKQTLSLAALRAQGSWPLVVLALFAAIAYGLIVGGDYGISLDEPPQTTYARQTLEIYQGTRAIDNTLEDPLQHGPFFSLTAYVAGSWVGRTLPGWTFRDGMHFIYYLSFVMATFFIGVLARRYVSRAAAWLTAGLFFAQPLLLGHAFINPKDIPFMAFFFGGLTLGILALPNATRQSSAAADGANPDDEQLGKTGTAHRAARPLLQALSSRPLIAGSLVAAAVLAILWFWRELLPLLLGILAQAYQGHAPAPIQAAFSLIATDAYKTPLDLYQLKLIRAFGQFRLGVSALFIAAMILAWGIRLRHILAAAASRRRGYLLVAGAGVMIGLATSIRALAPWAAVPLVALYLLHLRSRRQAAAWILILAVTSVGACIATSPFFWSDTVTRYLQSVLTLSSFPWTGYVLFNGHLLEQLSVRGTLSLS